MEFVLNSDNIRFMDRIWLKTSITALLWQPVGIVNVLSFVRPHNYTRLLPPDGAKSQIEYYTKEQAWPQQPHKQAG